MKKPNASLKIFLIAGFFSLFLFNPGILRCASPPDGPDNLSPQVKRSENFLGIKRDQSWLRDQQVKNERFKELEWVIKQNLLKQYGQMETAANLGDDAD